MVSFMTKVMNAVFRTIFWSFMLLMLWILLYGFNLTPEQAMKDISFYMVTAGIFITIMVRKYIFKVAEVVFIILSYALLALIVVVVGLALAAFGITLVLCLFIDYPVLSSIVSISVIAFFIIFDKLSNYYDEKELQKDLQRWADSERRRREYYMEKNKRLRRR